MPWTGPCKWAGLTLRNRWNRFEVTWGQITNTSIQLFIYSCSEWFLRNIVDVWNRHPPFNAPKLAVIQQQLETWQKSLDCWLVLCCSDFTVRTMYTELFGRVLILIFNTISQKSLYCTFKYEYLILMTKKDTSVSNKQKH